MAASAANYMGFNLSPGAQGGQGPYGAVPGDIGLPPSIYSEVGSVVPSLPGITQGAAGNIGSEEQGVLSQGTQNLIQNKAAALGVSAGVPGGAAGNTLTNENILSNMGLTSENLSNQGIGNYLSFLGGVGNSQLSPNLTTDIASNNALMNAAPNPTAAAQQQQQLMMQYFNMLNGGNNPAGGLGASNPLGTPPSGDSYELAGTNHWIPGLPPSA